MRKVLYIITAIALIIIVRYIVSHNVGENELWVEKVSVPEGGIIEVYHSHKCIRDKPFSIETEDKIEFKKKRFSVYDICILDDEAKMLNEISRFNNTRLLERGWENSEDIESFVRYENDICDLSNRDYDVEYSWIGRKTKKLSKPVSAFVLLDELGREFKW